MATPRRAAGCDGAADKEPGMQSGAGGQRLVFLGNGDGGGEEAAALSGADAGRLGAPDPAPKGADPVPPSADLRAAPAARSGHGSCWRWPAWRDATERAPGGRWCSVRLSPLVVGLARWMVVRAEGRWALWYPTSRQWRGPARACGSAMVARPGWPGLCSSSGNIHGTMVLLRVVPGHPSGADFAVATGGGAVASDATRLADATRRHGAGRLRAVGRAYAPGESLGRHSC
ncbi:hypothetical protein C2845_PM01G37490 [Panicum miliaceum]|uniref:Uncharacterized protein n=1 Tax=Panicum miliaceum TaxID=4540 RepID=A0A3L6TXJ1_PANMI|nr:hypothetical protein C2845_PM01G37490 [Panicum miliaceum]